VSGAAPRLHEVPLTQEEIDRILRLCGTRALLIGGQALGVWAVRLGVLPPRSLGPTVSSDIDFVGSGAVASELCKALGGNWKTRQGTLDDAGSQVAKLYRKVGEDGVQQIDFLSGVVGLDAAAVRKRAVEITLEEGTVLKVMHPLDVLESRLRNLAAIPSKRNAVGVVQARFAVTVTRAFVEDHIAEGRDPKILRQALKRIETIALDSALCTVAFTYDIDVLRAIPLDRVPLPRYARDQFPRVLARLATRREKHEKLLTRRTALKTKRSRVRSKP
jgi:hypothetical protein